MEYVNKKLEEFNNYIKNKKVAIIGLGTSNIPLIEYLHNLGSSVVLFNNKQVDNSILDMIYEYKLEYSFGENYLSKLKGFDVIFRSPSCRPDLPEIEAEVKRGAVLTSEIELVMELCPGTVIGVTGSDRKNNYNNVNIWNIKTIKFKLLYWWKYRYTFIHKNKIHETWRLCGFRT